MIRGDQMLNEIPASDTRDLLAFKWVFFYIKIDTG